MNRRDADGLINLIDSWAASRAARARALEKFGPNGGLTDVYGRHEATARRLLVDYIDRLVAGPEEAQ